VRAEKCLLAGVLGIVAVAQHAHEIGEDLRPPAAIRSGCSLSAAPTFLRTGPR
jgi:hypothetical protein